MPQSKVHLKNRILKLLREDVEFRYAVIVFLSIENIRSG